MNLLRRIGARTTVATILAALTLTLAGGASVSIAQAAEETQTVTLSEAAVNVAPNDLVAPPEGAQAPEATLTAPVEIPADATEFRLTGTNWFRVDGSASGYMVQYNSGGIEPVVEAPNEIPGNSFAGTRGRAWKLALAGQDGTLNVTVPVPTPENSSLEEALLPGDEFSVQLLGGSIANEGDGDWVRNPQLTLRIAEEPVDDQEAPDWAHLRVSPTSDPNAVAYISRDVGSGTGGQIRIQGQGWVNEREGTGSTIALKLNGDLNDARTGFHQYTRAGSAIVEHPSASGDDTIWALIAPNNPSSHPHIYPIDNQGNFDITVDAPAGLSAGQHLSVLFQSGRFAVETVNRAVTSPSLVVGGQAWEDPRDAVAEVVCTTEVTVPTVEILTPTAELGGELRVRGEGWCHPEDGQGASSIALKIDEGNYSRPDTSLHSNQTIWYIVDADSPDMDPTTGTWEASIALPDGTEATSDPAFTECRHSLRLLTGSLKAGDANRTLKSETFVVGQDKPCTTPAPVEASEDLSEDTRGAVSIQQFADSFVVSVAGGRQGDWIYLTDFAADGSPLFSWDSQWFRLDQNAEVRVPLAGLELPVGESKISVQSGNSGQEGELLGWGSLRRAAGQDWSQANLDGSDTDDNRESSVGSGGTDRISGQGTNTVTHTERVHTTVVETVEVEVPVLVPAPASSGGLLQQYAPGVSDVTVPIAEAPLLEPMPTHTPSLPAATELTDATAGEIGARLEGGLLILTLPQDTSTWVHVGLYPDELPLGWIAQDTAGEIRIDISGVPDGDYSFAIQDVDGELIGWAQLLLGEESDDAAAPIAEAAEAAEPPAAAPGPVAPISEHDPLLATSDWILIALGAGVLGGAAAAALAARSVRSAQQGAHA
ncbi:MAG: hypothetical protein ACTHZ5_06065 [Micrococcaceae bacterium]